MHSAADWTESSIKPADCCSKRLGSQAKVEAGESADKPAGSCTACSWPDSIGFAWLVKVRQSLGGSWPQVACFVPTEPWQKGCLFQTLEASAGTVAVVDQQLPGRTAGDRVRTGCGRDVQCMETGKYSHHRCFLAKDMDYRIRGCHAA